MNPKLIESMRGTPPPKSTEEAWKEHYLLQEQYIEELEAEIERTKQERNAIAKNTREPLLLKLDEAKERIKRLEQAGDAVAAIIGPPGSAHWADENEVDDAWNNWTKSKEAKP